MSPEELAAAKADADISLSRIYSSEREAAKTRCAEHWVHELIEMVEAQAAEIERLRGRCDELLEERDRLRKTLMDGPWWDLQMQIQERDARIQELEAVLKEADQYRRESLDRIMEVANQRDKLEEDNKNLKILNEGLMENGNGLRSRAQKAEARIQELEGTVATLREIAIGERASALFNGPWDGGLPTGASYDATMAKAKEDARRQLHTEHPGAFGCH